MLELSMALKKKEKKKLKIHHKEDIPKGEIENMQVCGLRFDFDDNLKQNN